MFHMFGRSAAYLLDQIEEVRDEVELLDEGKKDALKASGAAVAGGAAGAASYGAIGGIGLALCGTAVGVTLGPFVCIGVGVGTAGYGLFWLGKQSPRGG